MKSTTRSAKFMVLSGVACVLSVFLSLKPVSYASVKNTNSRFLSSPQKIIAIRLRGLKVMSSKTALAHLAVKNGSLYSAEAITADIKRLHATGLFTHIEVFRKRTSRGVILTYKLKENKIIARINIHGAKKIEEDEIRKQFAFKANSFFNLSQIHKTIDNIRKIYEENGFFAVQIDYKLKKIHGNQHELTYHIDESYRAVVRNILFQGNNVIEDSVLRSYMQTGPAGLFSFFTDSGLYRDVVLEQDVQRLHAIYQEKGYYLAKISKPKILLEQNKKNIVILISIDEGHRFNIGNIRFDKKDFETSALEDQIELESGAVFSYQKLVKSILNLQALYGDEGYAFANISPDIKPNEEKKTLDITFYFNPGHKVHVNRIDISGNTQTHEHVIRRELQIDEGQIYHETKKRESEARVRQLGFFESVYFAPKGVPNSPESVNMELVVKPRRTGHINLAIGYSDFFGTSIKGGISEPNFFGLGHAIDASIDISARSKLFSINYVYPYALKSQWQLAIKVFNIRTQRTGYFNNQLGGGFDFTKEWIKNWFFSYGLNWTETDLTLDEATDPELFPVETVNGESRELSVSLNHDKRNDRLYPTKGYLLSAEYKHTGLGGDLKYGKAKLYGRYYKELWGNKLVWRNNLEYGKLFSETEPPFNQLFLLGGAVQLRGYEWFSVGSYKLSRRALEEALAAGHPNPELVALKPFGGAEKLVFQTEVQFTLLEQARIMGVLFAEAGAAADHVWDSENFQYDVGFGLRWFSPIGPLRFEWGYPLNPKEVHGPASLRFYFFLGKSF